MYFLNYVKFLFSFSFSFSFSFYPFSKKLTLCSFCFVLILIFLFFFCFVFVGGGRWGIWVLFGQCSEWSYSDNYVNVVNETKRTYLLEFS